MDGIIIEILTHLLCLALGGVAGYKIGINKTIKQTQKSGDNSQQIQQGSGNITIYNHKDDK